MPVVLVGTIVDIFLKMESARVSQQLEQYEEQLRAILQRETASRLSDIAGDAQKDFAAIDAGKVPELEKAIFQDIGQIEALYTDKLTAALG